MITRTVRNYTRLVRQHLPASAVSVVRRLALYWGMATARWRRLPDIVVVGAQRSGTTTLFRMLEEHPQLVRPTLSKGTGYFDDSYRRGPRWYAAHFPLRLSTRWLAGGDVRTFECSGYYLFHPLAAERIARDLPGAQVVVMLRDPVARAYSAHRHEKARGFENLEFAEALAVEESRIAAETPRLEQDPNATSYEHRHHAYLGRSSYQPQLERLVKALGSDRVHVVEAERLFADPVTEFDTLQRRLGLRRHRTTVLEAWNARPGADLDPALAQHLRQRFAPDDDYLAGLLGHQPAWREEH
ncbi:sulfotransferase family protein [Nocardioides sp. Bht2]|uniref:sulfotransferase family protein n=1 Tax=Nocardioides sp. Bht2 TaxID=3392297 RepID=UPI0039B38DB1